MEERTSLAGSTVKTNPKHQPGYFTLKTAVETQSSRPFDFAQGGLSLPNGRRAQREKSQFESRMKFPCRVRN
jgi:hypothetical protein